MGNLAPKIHWLLNENLGSGYHCNNHIFSSTISPNFRIASVLYLSKLYILCFLLLHLLFFNGVLHKTDSSYPCHTASIRLSCNIFRQRSQYFTLKLAFVKFLEHRQKADTFLYARISQEWSFSQMLILFPLWKLLSWVSSHSLNSFQHYCIPNFSWDCLWCFTNSFQSAA